MIPFSAVVAVIGCVLSLFLVTTFKGFDNYHQVQRVTRSYDTSSLAAASRLARSGSNLLTGLSSSLASVNATSTTETNNRYHLLQNYFSEIDSSVSANPSLLMDTISRGLTYSSNKTLHNSYTVDLVQSNYIPAQTTKSLPRYAQTLVTDEHIAKIINPIQLRSDLDAGANRLRISAAMLSALVSDVSAITANPSAYGIEINDRGLDLGNIPNAARINWQVPLANLSLDPAQAKTTEVRLVRKQAVAQIRFNASNTIALPPPLVVVPPPVPAANPQPPLVTASCNPGWDWSVTAGQCVLALPAIDLVLQAIPYDRIAIVYDPNKAINSSNPIEIINKKMGGMNSIYKEADGDLHISIAAIPTKANSLMGSTADISDLVANAQISATMFALNDDALPSHLVLGGSAAGATVSLDVLPRARSRYGTVSNSFKHNGQLIAAGSVIVAVRQPGLTNVGRPDPKQGEFESYRIYSKEGVFQGQFAAQFGIDNAAKLNFSYTAKGTTVEDPRFGTVALYQDFSTSDLFKNQSTYASVSAWLRMQEDLASNLQIDILNKKNTWQTDIFKQLYETNLAEQTVINNLKGLIYIRDVFHIDGNLAAFNMIYPNPRAIDAKALNLMQSRLDAAINYAEAVVQKKLAQDGVSSSTATWGGIAVSGTADLNAAQKAVDAAKKALDLAISDYDTYIKSKSVSTASNNVAAKPSVTSTTSTNSTTVKPVTTTSTSATTTIVKTTKAVSPATLSGSSATTKKKK